MTKKLIKVTKEDLKLGIKSNATLCPIALAARRTFNAWHVKWLYCWGICNGSTKLTSCDKKRVRQLVESIDAGKKIKPFSFYVKVGND